jgi:8-oxo-dGTP pyrophosphatase MutT (NUDIX family)
MYSKRGEDWSFFGGHLEPQEDFISALKREIFEELHVEIKDGDFQRVSSFSNFID